ncbi:MAG TPA: hypothetical protein VGM11_06390 [Acidobacteriaceae bacterium]|jgi:Arc/MetJ-type ribon-helix-helix transcriptional regulator
MAPLTHETMQLTITLPKTVAQHLREQVATGQYANESEYIESILLSETLFPPIDQDELTQWVNSEGVRRLHAMEEDPSSSLTSAEVFDFLNKNDDEGEAT